MTIRIERARRFEGRDSFALALGWSTAKTDAAVDELVSRGFVTIERLGANRIAYRLHNPSRDLAVARRLDAMNLPRYGTAMRVPQGGFVIGKRYSPKHLEGCSDHSNHNGMEYLGEQAGRLQFRCVGCRVTEVFAKHVAVVFPDSP